MQDDSRPSESTDDTREENLSGAAAAKKIDDLVNAGNSCFFCTVGMNAALHARPMTVTEVEEGGVLWFFTEIDSLKNVELDRDPRVTLFFKEGDNAGHLKLDGTAAIVTDKATIHRLWTPKMRAWFTEGEDDPRISLLRVEPVSGEYWDNRHGTAIAGIKMMFGALTGTRGDDGVHGKLKL